jgi:NAD+ synthase (glutamine-hydrolysing)
MRVHNPKQQDELGPGLVGTLAALRFRRGFDAEACIAAKAALLNDYFSRHKLKACVLGVSGGVDSALALGLAARAAQQPGSPLKKIVPLLMPIHSPGATNQDKATARGREVIRHFGLEEGLVDLSLGNRSVKAAVDTGLGLTGGDWAEGQLVSYIRAPALYYAASLLAQEGLPGLVLGTTNGDEGAYLGFFGKASDGMVDLQLISDLHKSEVYAAAAALGVPQGILQAVPTGDMFDGRADTDVFGAPYDFVELFLALKSLPEDARAALEASWSAAERAQFNALAANLENLHRYNAHKYSVGSPAVHLDVYPSRVPGGWQYGPADKQFAAKADETRFVAPFTLPDELLARFSRTQAPRAVAKTLDDPRRNPVIEVTGLLSADETRLLLADLDWRDFLPAGLNGMRVDFDPARDPTGSWRATSYCPALADVLWRRLQGLVPALEAMPAGTSADAEGGLVWRAVGVSPLFRFIRYAGDGKLVAHYDSPYDFGDGRRTLKSMIVYLSETQGPGGETRFIRDPGIAEPPLQRAYADWDRVAQDDEVLLRLKPAAGGALIFGHRLLHDSAPLAEGSGEKLVMRADIVYDRIAPP